MFMFDVGRNQAICTSLIKHTRPRGRNIQDSLSSRTHPSEASVGVDGSDQFSKACNHYFWSKGRIPKMD